MKLSSSTTLTLGLTSLTLLSGLILSSSLASADDAVDEVTITVPTSCSMSSTGTNSHTAEILNGQTNSSVGESTIKAYCNDNNGFSIYAIGYTDDELGKTVLTSSTLGSTHDILTGTNTTGNSSWAMKLSTITSPTPTYPIIIAGSTDDTDKEQGDPDYTSFQEVPDDYTKVAYRTSSTDVGANAEGSILKTTYQAYISPTQSAGTYQGKVKYVLVYPHNGDVPVKPVSGPTGCETPVPNLTYMQDLNSSNKATILAGMTEDAQYFLKDARDEKSYCVAKLRDGNIWMTQNLDHDIVTTEDYYTNENTDIGWNSSTDSYDNETWTAESATRVTSDLDWSGLTTQPESYNPGDLYVGHDGTPVIEGDQHYHFGNYYNWSAAIASNETGSFMDMDVDRSICPANWTLPKYDDDVRSGSATYLLAQYGWNPDNSTLGDGLLPYSSPFYLILAGEWDGSPNNLDYEGYFLPSMAGDSDYVFGIIVEENGAIHPRWSLRYDDGYSVRCLSR